MEVVGDPGPGVPTPEAEEHLVVGGFKGMRRQGFRGRPSPAVSRGCEEGGRGRRGRGGRR